MNKNICNIPIRVSLTTTNIQGFGENVSKNNINDIDKNLCLYISNLRPNVTLNNIRKLSSHIKDARFEVKDNIK